jgi:hypothetical protein
MTSTTREGIDDEAEGDDQPLGSHAATTDSRAASLGTNLSHRNVGRLPSSTQQLPDVLLRASKPGTKVLDLKRAHTPCTQGRGNLREGFNDTDG